MPYGPVSLQSVRSINQRALLLLWQRTSGGRLFPEIAEYAPPEREIKQLLLWGVEHDGATRRYRMQRQAERLTEMIATNFTGRTLDEVAPPLLKPFVMESADECVESCCAVYSIMKTIDHNAHVVECERLLLPFGRDGVVEYFLAALQLISYQGTVDHTTVADEFRARCEVTFSGVIPSNAQPDTVIILPPRALALRPQPIVVADHPAPVEAPGADKPRESRRTVRKTGRIKARGLSEICTVREISASGASLDVPNAAKVPDHFSLVMEMESAGRTCAVIWRKERQLGVEFQ